MLVGTIITWLIVGAIVGYIARLLMPGPDPMGCLATSGLGVTGSLVGGTLANLLFDRQLALSAAGFVGSIIGAMVVLFIIRRTRRPPGPAASRGGRVRFLSAECSGLSPSRCS